MSLPRWTESAGYTEVTTAAVDCTLSGKVPATATKVRHCSASAGLGGRLLAYRFSGDVAELHQHALAEFTAHWDAPQATITRDTKSPFSENRGWPSSGRFDVKTEWMVAPNDAIGSIYRSSDGQSAHRPTIFVDEKHGVLYFWMAD